MQLLIDWILVIAAGLFFIYVITRRRAIARRRLRHGIGKLALKRAKMRG